MRGEQSLTDEELELIALRDEVRRLRAVVSLAADELSVVTDAHSHRTQALGLSRARNLLRQAKEAQ